MALTHAVLPCAQCSSGASRHRLFQTRQLHHSRTTRMLQCLPMQTLYTSTLYRCVRECGRERTTTTSKSIIRAGGFENSAQYEDDSRVSNQPEQTSNYVATRTYRKALASLRVTGEALPWQVNAALAADGGRTAVQELAQGRPMLVVETHNPGRFSEGSTVSTKLQAPTRAVVERAKSAPQNDRQSSPIGRAFAIAFQAVRLLKLSRFELCFFKPGTVRGMDDYKEGEMMGFLEVSDASALSEIVKGVCSYALACVKENAYQRVNLGMGMGTRLFQNRQKVQPTIVESSAVRISTLSEADVLAHVEMIVQDKSFRMGRSMVRHRLWWERPLATQAVVKTGVDAQLVDEFVPAHALHFKLPPSNFVAVGLQKTDDSSCTIHLTHAQMMDLADVLDLYCGDPYTGSGETVSTNLDIPRRSWIKGAQTLAVGALASAVGGALLLGMLSITKSRGQMETPAVSIFDMAFLEKLKELRGTESVHEQMDHVHEQMDHVHEQMDHVHEQTEAGDEQAEAVEEQTEAVDEQPIAEPNYKSPARVQMRVYNRH